MPILVSPLLRDAGFAHAFSMRHGGVSEGPFATLNLGGALPEGSEDPPERVAENLRRLAVAAGFDEGRPLRIRQVHGCGVVDADSPLEGPPPEGDAVVASPRAVGGPRCVLVRTADCVPLLLACPRTGHVAAVHAGWRGLVAGVVEAAIGALAERGVRPGELLAAIGPAIGVDAYEVGGEVAMAFCDHGLAGRVDRSRPRPHVDCHGAARTILVRSGVSAAAIDGFPLCTASNATDFFSFRRDGVRSGRLGALIGPR